MFFKNKLNENGKVSILIVILIASVLVFMMYNLNMSKISFINMDTKSKLDEIIRAEIIKTIDRNGLIDYRFGTDYAYFSYDIDNKTLTRNFTPNDNNYNRLVDNLKNRIQNKFTSSIETEEILNPNFEKLSVKFNYETIDGPTDGSGYYNKVYVPYIKVSYIYTFETPIYPGAPVDNEIFTVDDVTGVQGKIEVIRSSTASNRATVAISGQVSVRYRIQVNLPRYL